MKARKYPKANATHQWWETRFSRGRFDRIEKILLHTTETVGWPGYSSGASAPTLTYHPRLRAWRQHNYLDTSARALMDPSGTLVRENRDNVIQIEMICYSDEKLAATVGGLPVSKLSDGNFQDLAEFIVFIRKEWGGPPLVFPPRSDARMTGPEYDAFQGIVGHDDASGNTHWDPGAFDFPRLIATVKKLEEGTTTPISPEEDEVTARDVWTYPITPVGGGEAVIAADMLRYANKKAEDARDVGRANALELAALKGIVFEIANKEGGVDLVRLETVIRESVDGALDDLRLVNVKEEGTT